MELMGELYYFDHRCSVILFAYDRSIADVLYDFELDKVAHFCLAPDRWAEENGVEIYQGDR